MDPGPPGPGRYPALAAARAHALHALYQAASRGLPTLTDKGYTGAGIGIHTPLRGADLAPSNRTRNQLITALRAPAERANALLKKSRPLQRITLCPQRIGHITAAGLVILTMQRGHR